MHVLKTRACQLQHTRRCTVTVSWIALHTFLDSCWKWNHLQCVISMMWSCLVSSRTTFSWMTVCRWGCWRLPLAQKSLWGWRGGVSEEEVGFRPQPLSKTASRTFVLTWRDFCRAIWADDAAASWISEGHPEKVPWGWTDPQGKWWD